MVVRALLLALAILSYADNFAFAQVTPTDDPQFRRQQESGRLDAARENARVERERSGYANPAPAATTRSNPASELDQLRMRNRLRDEQGRIEREGDRLRAEQQRQDQNRVFGNPGP